MVRSSQRWRIGAWLVLLASGAVAWSASSGGHLQGAAALGVLAGTWQSDTVNGVSALSRCGWTPAGGALVCEQTITMPDGERHALNFFMPDSSGRRYVFYVLQRPGDPLRPVPLTINGRIWVYGGLEAGPDGTWHRTVNDFTAGSTYTWRQESSSDGTHWIAGTQGRARRIR